MNDKQLTLLDLINDVIEIAESDISWEEKNDMIFSKEYSSKIFLLTDDLGIMISNHFSPQTTYRQDVNSFTGQLKSIKKNLHHEAGKHTKKS